MTQKNPNKMTWAEWERAERPDTQKPNYNDGNWHGWNGGECPVDPRSKAETLWPDGVRKSNSKVGDLNWDRAFLFRVTKPYVEPKKPREFWVFTNGHGDLCVSAIWRLDGIHVREVMGDEE